MTQPGDLPPIQDEGYHWPLALKVGIGLGGLVLVGGAATAIWGRAVVNQQVIPRLEAGLEETFERPVQIGQLERFTFNGFRIGPSYLPPTAAVQTEATVEAIDVTISWRDLVFQRIVRPSLTLIDANLIVVQAADGRWVDLTLPEPDDEDEGFISFKLGELRVENAQVSVTSLVPRPDAIVVAETILIQAVNGEVYLTALEEPDVEHVVFDVAGTLGEGQFRARGNGLLEQEQLNVSVQTNNLPTVGVNMFLPPELGLRGGTLDSNFTAELRRQDEVQPVSARGTAHFRDGEVLLSQLPEPIRDLNTTLRLQGDRVLLEETALSLGTIPLTAAGTVNFQTGYDLTTAVPAVSLAHVTALLDVDLPVQAAGLFQFEGVVSGPLGQPTLVGSIANLGPVQADQVTVESLSANVAASLEQLTLQALRVIPATGGFINGRGQVALVDLANLSFTLDLEADLPGDALAALYGVALPNQAVIGSVQAVGQMGGSLTNPEGVVQFQLPESTYRGGGRATLRDNVLVVDQTQFQVEGGQVDATALARLDQGDWSAEVTTADVPLERFTDQAQGRLSAVVNASGNLQTLNLAAIEASGTALIAEAEVALTPGSPSLLERGDWTTALRWAGSGVEVERFNAPGVTAAGFIATNFANHVVGRLPIDSVDLDVQLRAYNLERLAPLIPEPVRSEVALAGLTSFEGQITGPLANLRLQGNAQLDNLAVNALAFEPRLAGPVNLALAEGGEVDLRGGGDRITATLDRDLLPSQFALRRGATTAAGQMVNRQLTATLQNFPVEALNLAPAPDLGRLAGTLDATLSADLRDLANPAAQGFAAIANPALGNIVAESFVGRYSYGDGVVALADGELRFANSQYRLTGQAELATLAYSGQIDIIAGNFEDLLDTLGWADFADIGFSPPAEVTGTAADVATVPASLPAAPFLEQVQAFANFLALYEPRSNGTQLALPPLNALQGEFSGVITVQGEGLTADTVQATAEVRGQDWSWGRLLPCGPRERAESLDFNRPAIAPPAIAPGACNQFQLTARYDQGEFVVSPLDFRSPDTQVSFVGSGTLNDLDGQLTASGIPAELAELFVTLPAKVEGDIATTAQLGGSLSNPLVVGQVVVVDPRLNQQPLDSVAIDFTYDNALLRFDGAAVVTDPAQITLQGTVPYALPFMAVQPPSDQIDVLVSLQNESLELLNLLTEEQLRWDGGQGDITVRVGGTLAEPLVAGRAQFREAQLSSSALAAPMTNLNGTVLFDLEQVQVNQLQAVYGGGTLAANGRLPLQAEPVAALAQTKQAPAPTGATENPESPAGIAIALTEINVDYANLMAAQVDGQVLVGGAVLNPVVSGVVQVSRGLIRANNLLGQIGALPADDLASVDADPNIPSPLPDYVAAYRAERGGFAPPQTPPQTLPNQLMERVSLSNLNLVLADQLLIAGQPFYNLAASGNLAVNGTVADLQPEGVITLETGWINIFSTQFRLIPGETNTATFTPAHGLDPFLNVRMRARLQDQQVRQAAATPFFSAEVADTSGLTQGQVEFISVFATAFGFASELQNADSPGQATELIALTSRPARSQEDLVGLLGRSVLTNVAGASLGQVAGFFGSGVLAGFGDRIADTIGLRSFSVFPTTDTAADSAVGIGIGVEAAFDIGDRISVDALEILNSGNPPEVGVSYRFSNQLRARGSTNFSGNETVTVEYEVRF
ncbi:translocation/assembly module TamB domain-containing protein [Leptolyngbya sp. KIOST-1]|uniref:translocation/assembly module TamB domain-containing protein n=1 Tax=Leptolyngbya sp. KIOST-1 TaxID=1229172 RepID=UPI00056CC8C9|nr:translocation/assembly module TamB domain-containing protein [Leptolyngbya sp. KIOST-1]